MYLAVTERELEIPRPNVSSNESVLLPATNPRSNISSIEAVVPGPTAISSAPSAVSSRDFGCHMHGVFAINGQLDQSQLSVRMSKAILAHPRTVVAGSLILSPGVGRALGEVVSS